MLRDLQYAVRGLLTNRGFTLTAAGSLALAIGGSMAVFAVLNAVWSANIHRGRAQVAIW